MDKLNDHEQITNNINLYLFNTIAEIQKFATQWLLVYAENDLSSGITLYFWGLLSALRSFLIKKHNYFNFLMQSTRFNRAGNPPISASIKRLLKTHTIRHRNKMPGVQKP